MLRGDKPKKPRGFRSLSMDGAEFWWRAHSAYNRGYHPYEYHGQLKVFHVGAGKPRDGHGKSNWGWFEVELEWRYNDSVTPGDVEAIIRRVMAGGWDPAVPGQTKVSKIKLEELDTKRRQDARDLALVAAIMNR